MYLDGGSVFTEEGVSAGGWGVFTGERVSARGVLFTEGEGGVILMHTRTCY